MEFVPFQQWFHHGNSHCSLFFPANISKCSINHSQQTFDSEAHLSEELHKVGIG